MTMPDERTRALLYARRVLSDLSQMASTTDVDALRQRANDVLRHYPDDGMTELIARDSSWLQWPCRSMDTLSKKATDEGDVVAGFKMRDSIAMGNFRPNRRQKKRIEAGLRGHRAAQANGRPAPERLIRKWSSEVGIQLPKLNRPNVRSRFRRVLKRLFLR